MILTPEASSILGHMLNEKTIQLVDDEPVTRTVRSSKESSASTRVRSGSTLDSTTVSASSSHLDEPKLTGSNAVTNKSFAFDALLYVVNSHDSN